MKAVRTSVLCLCCLLAGASAVEAVLPLRDQWQAACRALGAGQAGAALALMREFDHWYGREPAVQAPDFREVWLRLWGLAALQAGEPGEGLRLIEQWLGENGPGARFRAFMRFQAASACRALGDEDRARGHWAVFLQEHPELPECALIRWMWADQHLAGSRFAEARALLREVHGDAALPASGRALAQAALGLVELALGDRDAALVTLDAPAAEGGGPVLAIWQALLAPSLVQGLLEREQPAEAVRVAGWFDRPENLRQRIGQFQQALERQSMQTAAGGSIRQTVWNQHWEEQLRRLGHSLGQTESAEEGMAVLYQLRLRALLAARQAQGAGILARALLAGEDTLVPGLRAAAYAAGIEASHQLARWEEAEQLAARFVEACPEDPALPDILFLNARTAAGRGAWNNALGQLDLLLDRFPEHRARLSWRATGADWRLQAGQAAEALAVFAALEQEAPAPWRPFLRFQQGRCLEKLQRPAAALAAHAAAEGMDGAAAALREQALVSQLRLLLRGGDGAAFGAGLARYRRQFPEGLHRLMAENLAGAWHQRQGRLAEAARTWAAVAAHAAPEAAFARGQLSDLYRQSNDMPALRRHALDWIRQGLASGEPLPPGPFSDCLLYQRQTQHPALPEALLADLLDDLQGGRPLAPAVPFFSLLEDRWDAYRAAAGAPDGSLADWVEASARLHHGLENWPAYAACQLFRARQFEQAGRPDSADTRRIRILQVVPPAVLDESALHAVAATADAYDFPEAAPLLELFLARHPRSPLRPDALQRLAVRLRRDGHPVRARERLAEVLAAWPDSPVFPAACLLLAGWLLEEGEPEGAFAAAQAALERTGLPARETAQALLLRARADVAAGRLDRARLDCRRILALYPDFADTASAAAALVESSIPSPDENDAPSA